MNDKNCNANCRLFRRTCDNACIPYGALACLSPAVTPATSACYIKYPELALCSKGKCMHGLFTKPPRRMHITLIHHQERQTLHHLRQLHGMRSRVQGRP